MKKFIAVITVLAVAISMSSCSKKEGNSPEENKNSAQQQKTEEASAKTEASAEEAKEPETAEVAGNSSFNFDIPSFSYTPEPVKAAEARIEISPSDYEINISQNLSGSDRAKLSGLSDDELEQLIKTKESFLNELAAAMRKENIDVKMDTVSGEMVLDSSILFAVDDVEVSAEGKNFLKKFIPAYASVVKKADYKDFISEITVEGHTDTQGTYEYNKNLSQKRADNVVKYILSDEVKLNASEHELFEKLIKSYGRSYDYPIKDSSGKVDMDASRRVTIGFLISIN